MGVDIPWVGGRYTHGISTPLPIVYRPPYQWYIDPPTLYKYWLFMRSTHDYQVRIVMSRLKLKVNNCLLNNKEFFKLFNSIFNKIGYNCFIIFQDWIHFAKKLNKIYLLKKKKKKKVKGLLKIESSDVFTCPMN